MRRDVAAGLNEAFYRGAPHRYFEQRLVSLLAVAQSMNEPDLSTLPECTLLESALGREAEFDEESFEPSARQLYVAAECQVLLHHVGESLIRIVLGHLGDPPCPWIEIASLTNFGEFKKRVRNEIVDVPAEQMRETLKPIVIGHDEQLDGEVAALAKALLTNTVGFVRTVAARLLNESPLYNAAKHGFAVKSGHHMVRFHFPLDDAPEEDRDAVRQFADSLAFNGVTLECLEWVKDDPQGTVRWFRAERFVEVSGDLALIYGAVRVMSNMWAVAAARYGGGGEVPLYSVDFSPRSIDELTKPTRGVFRRSILARPLSDDEAAKVISEMEAPAIPREAQ